MKLVNFKLCGFLVLSVMLFATSCTSYKQVPYLQNSNEIPNMVQADTVFENRIQPRDLLTILVTSPNDVTASAPYNLLTSVPYELRLTATSQPTYQNYLVDKDGNIEFPIVGTLHVAGLTKKELETIILNKIKGAFTIAPIVTVRFADFKISVLGEVANPGTFTISNEKVNIFQALALARDMTIYGMRENVKVIREDVNGKTSVHELDLTDASVITSPYYHLQQNDVVYVTPNKAKAKGSDVGSTTSLWFSTASILVSLTSLLYNILHN
ncbi:MAG: polysaccharide biosynthesis/export family protein [Bacteroidaceae bacterium]|nr:polysaccharide biosynthesis/export family protein [Bacteroidaceae bacterium]